MPAENLQVENAAAVQDARRLLGLRRCEEALARLAPVLASDPSNGAAHGLAGACHLVLGRLDLAESHARSQTAADVTNPQGPFLLALVLKRLGRRDAAIDAAQEAINRAPERAVGHQAMTQACLRNPGTTQRARDAAREALARQPNDPQMLVNAAESYMYNGRRRVRVEDRRVAREFLEQALAIDPSHVEARYEMAALTQFGGRPLASIRALGDVLRTDPLHQRAHERLGHVLSRLTLRCHLVAFALVTAMAVAGGIRAVAVVTGLLAVATAAWLVHGLRTGLRSALAPTLRLWVRAQPGFALWLALVLVALGAVVVAAVAPAAVAQTAQSVGWFALIAGSAAGLMRRRP